ncbi:putative competence/damage-inducible protein CinA [Talaromyces proteolyticus]|uniref:Competence/damage-inducible protein CinA n=1 Tax=Talaromyces proteolyticus TaxID=1131652 RepID=A0AAD4PZG2_9EURO|nr:putative competence/damage-inducible protein CinA [Talaromyces proteolyticus]KAH8695946.1 putative competence/damage-inducible protein CinA [Talaromyces proteolyticus]
MADSEFPPSSIRPLVHEIATLLKEKKETVSVAETAAGGLTSASLLSVPGASSYFKGGLTLYTLESRLAFAGWTTEHIKSYQGPTTQIVAHLAEHTRKTLGSTYTISESGTAGPGGGSTPNRVPGTVFLAVAAPSGTYVREVNTGFGEDRERNMVGFAAEGLKLLRDVLKGDAKL